MTNIKSDILTVSLETKANIYLKDNDVYLNDNKILNRSDIKTSLKGEHNLKNILFVLLISNLYNLDLIIQE